jgi:multiple sugar transport system permease protein
MTVRAEAIAPSGRAVGTSIWSRAWQNHAPGYLFLLPWFIGFFGLTIGPILSSLYLSFTDFDLLTPANWIGTANYERMFTSDRNFAASMRVTLFFVLFSVPLKLAFALCIAMLLNRGMRGLPLYRALSSTCRPCSAPRSRLRSCGGRFSPRTASSTISCRSSALSDRAGSVIRIRRSGP